MCCCYPGKLHQIPAYSKVVEVSELQAFIQDSLKKGRMRQKKKYDKIHRDSKLP